MGSGTRHCRQAHCHICDRAPSTARQGGPLLHCWAAHLEARGDSRWVSRDASAISLGFSLALMGHSWGSPLGACRPYPGLASHVHPACEQHPHLQSRKAWTLDRPLHWLETPPGTSPDPRRSRLFFLGLQRAGGGWPAPHVGVARPPRHLPRPRRVIHEGCGEGPRTLEPAPQEAPGC